MDRTLSGTIFLAQKNYNYDSDNDNDNKKNTFITLGYTCKKNVRKCGNILSVHRIYKCRNSSTIYQTIRNKFEDVYGCPMSGDMVGFMDYRIDSIESAILVFDAIIKNYIPNAQ